MRVSVQQVWQHCSVWPRAIQLECIPCSSKDRSGAAVGSADCAAGLAVSSQRGAARKGLLCLERAAGGPMLNGSFGVGALPTNLGAGGGGIKRSCSFTSDFSACTEGVHCSQWQAGTGLFEAGVCAHSSALDWCR